MTPSPVAPRDDRSVALFWSLAVVRFATWWLLPQALARTLPLDVIEGLAWGREWQWGYWKHPPLAAAMLEGTTEIFGRRAVALWALGPLSVTLCLWAVWRFARRRLPPWPSLAAVLALDGVYYYGYASTKLNPDVLQLPLWALLVLCLDQALSSRRSLDWLACGALAGLGLLAKYYTLALLLPLLLLLLLSEAARPVRRSLGPWLALAVAVLVMAPHLSWLAAHDFAPLVYARERSAAATGLLDRLAQPILFLAGQGLILLPMFVFLVVVGWRPQRAAAPSGLLLAASGGPLLLTLVVSLLFGVSLSGASRENWGTPLWSFLGVLLVAGARPFACSRRRLLAAWLLLLSLGAGAYAARVGIGPALGQAPDRVRFPGPALAERVVQAWRERHGSELPFAAGNVWLAGNVAYYAAERVPVYVDLEPERADWIDESELRRRGAVFLWNPRLEDSAYREALAARFPDAEVLAPLRLELDEIGGAVDAFVGWAMLRPAPSEPFSNP